MIQIRPPKAGQSCYIYIPNDNVTIPFRTLTYREYREYNQYYQNEIFQSDVEEEIFIKCVLNNDLVENLDSLAAGWITLLAQIILSLSGPNNDINEELKTARNIASNCDLYMASIICSVFNSYTIEDVFELDYPTILVRFTQAEQLLVERGFIQEKYKFNKKTTEDIDFIKENRELAEHSNTDNGIIQNNLFTKKQIQKNIK